MKPQAESGYESGASLLASANVSLKDVKTHDHFRQDPNNLVCPKYDEEIRRLRYVVSINK